MKMLNRKNLLILSILGLFIGLGFDGFAQDKAQTMNWVEVINGEERKASAKMVDGEWVYEGDAELIEKMKSKMSDSDGEMIFIHEEGTDGSVRVQKMKFESKDGAEHIRIMGDDGEDQVIEVIVNDEEGNGASNIMVISSDEDNPKHEMSIWNSHNEDGSSKVMVINKGIVYEANDAETVAKVQEMSENGATGEEIVQALGLEESTSQMTIDIESDVTVTVDGDESSKEIVIVIKKVEILEVEEEEIPKSLRKGVEIEEDAIAKLSFYPNPSNGVFKVSGQSESTSDLEILVTDLNGKVIYKKTLIPSEGPFQEEIDLTGKEPGVYLVRVSQDKKATVRKVVVN